jgi:tetratricopeptide (TPR) repeat protein
MKKIKSKITTKNTVIHVNAELNLAIELHQKGQLEEAQACYEKILKTQPLHFDALHLLGAIASQRKNYQTAAELISKAIAINPNNARAHYNLGVALHELKQLDAAVSSYNIALELQPNFPAAQSNRSMALEQLGVFVSLIKNEGTNIELKFDVMFYDSIGMRFNDEVVAQQSMGGLAGHLLALYREMFRAVAAETSLLQHW